MLFKKSIIFGFIGVFTLGIVAGIGNNVLFCKNVFASEVIKEKIEMQSSQKQNKKQIKSINRDFKNSLIEIDENVEKDFKKTPLEDIVDIPKLYDITYWESGGYDLVVEATAYCATDDLAITARGNKVIADYTIAVDPKVIPLGSIVVINGKKHLADDTGGAIKGNIIDIAKNNEDECWNFGRQYNIPIKVYPPGMGIQKKLRVTKEVLDDLKTMYNITSCVPVKE